MENCQSPVSFSQSHTIISATDAGASENDFSDTIETKAVVVISLDSPGLLIDPKSQKKMSCGLLEAIWVQIHHSLKYAGVPRCLFSIRPRQMIGKTRVCRGKDWEHPWVSFCLLSGGKKNRFDLCSTLATRKISPRGKNSTTRSWMQIQSFDWTQTYNRIILPKNDCVYAICSQLSLLSSLGWDNISQWDEDKYMNI